MAIVSHIKKESYKVVPWKNAQGTSSEIVLHPEGASLEDLSFQWRLSTSDILKAGPFSQFHSFHRALALVTGTSLKLINLSQAKPPITLKALEVHHFEGADLVSSELTHGPVSDINFIYRKDEVQAEINILEFTQASRTILFHGKCILLFGLSGGVHMSVDLGEEKHQLTKHDTIKVDFEKNCIIDFEPQSKGSSIFAVEIS